MNKKQLVQKTKEHLQKFQDEKLNVNFNQPEDEVINLIEWKYEGDRPCDCCDDLIENVFYTVHHNETTGSFFEMKGSVEEWNEDSDVPKFKLVSEVNKWENNVKEVA